MNNNLENTLKKEMNNKERNAVLQFLLQNLKNDKLSHGAINAAAIKLNVLRSTISRLWKQAKTSKINDNEIYNLSSQKAEKLDNVFLTLQTCMENITMSGDATC